MASNNLYCLNKEIQQDLQKAVSLDYEVQKPLSYHEYLNATVVESHFADKNSRAIVGGVFSADGEYLEESGIPMFFGGG